MSSPEGAVAGALHRLIAQAVATHEAVAERLGINSTDLRCLEWVATEPGLTPSRLAELAGLTTGAVTGVLDRLESAGFLRREADPADRRRLRIRMVPERMAEMASHYEPLVDRAVALAGTWDPSARLRLADYLDGFASVLTDEAIRLRVAARGGMVGDRYTAPLAGATRGRLVLATGAPRLAFGAAALGQQVRVVAETAASRVRIGAGSARDELIRGTFEGPAPDVRASNGVVTVRYSRRLLDPRSRAAALELNPSIPWAIELEGGITDFDADLRDLRITGIELHGGANHLRARLGRPEGTVRLELDGGASEARFDRPMGTAAALHVRGGVSHLRFDGQRTESVGGRLDLQTDGFTHTPDRFEIEVSGATSTLTVGTE